MEIQVFHAVPPCDGTECIEDNGDIKVDFCMMNPTLCISPFVILVRVRVAAGATGLVPKSLFLPQAASFAVGLLGRRIKRSMPLA
jgi:hypothetical protein